MIIDINTRCRINSDAYQWTQEIKRGAVEENWRPIAFYRTLDFALDEMVAAKLCVESDLTEARAIAARLESTKQRIDEMLAGRRDAPIPKEVAAAGSFMTAAGGINYWFLKQVWAADSASEIPVLAEKALLLAGESITSAGNAPAALFKRGLK